MSSVISDEVDSWTALKRKFTAPYKYTPGHPRNAKQTVKRLRSSRASVSTDQEGKYPTQPQ